VLQRSSAASYTSVSNWSKAKEQCHLHPPSWSPCTDRTSAVGRNKKHVVHFRVRKDYTPDTVIGTIIFHNMMIIMSASSTQRFAKHLVTYVINRECILLNTWA
jgi:hypothetical protein